MKATIKLGSVNAAHLAAILDKNGAIIGECMDTPNNAAFAMSINKNAVLIKTPFNGVYTREDLAQRHLGLDEKYHLQFVRYF